MQLREADARTRAEVQRAEQQMQNMMEEREEKHLQQLAKVETETRQLVERKTLSHDRELDDMAFRHKEALRRAEEEFRTALDEAHVSHAQKLHVLQQQVVSLEDELARETSRVQALEGDKNRITSKLSQADTLLRSAAEEADHDRAVHGEEHTRLVSRLQRLEEENEMLRLSNVEDQRIHEGRMRQLEREFEAYRKHTEIRQATSDRHAASFDDENDRREGAVRLERQARLEAESAARRAFEDLRKTMGQNERVLRENKQLLADQATLMKQNQRLAMGVRAAQTDNAELAVALSEEARTVAEAAPVLRAPGGRPGSPALIAREYRAPSPPRPSSPLLGRTLGPGHLSSSGIERSYDPMPALHGSIDLGRARSPPLSVSTSNIQRSPYHSAGPQFTSPNAFTPSPSPGLFRPDLVRPASAVLGARRVPMGPVGQMM